MVGDCNACKGSQGAMKNSRGRGMIQVKINATKCTGCGACHDHLPGLLEKATDGILLVNLGNGNISPLALLLAVDVCGQKALSLEAMR